MNGADQIEQGLAEMERLNLEALRTSWRRQLNSPPPVRSADLLRRLLASKLQEAAYGGMSAELKQRLRLKSAATRKPALQPGTVLTREWRGETHVVEVRDGSFEHLGTSYASLSEVARAITGARWSGPRFFGLAKSDRKLAA